MPSVCTACVLCKRVCVKACFRIELRPRKYNENAIPKHLVNREEDQLSNEPSHDLTRDIFIKLRVGQSQWVIPGVNFFLSKFCVGFWHRDISTFAYCTVRYSFMLNQPVLQFYLVPLSDPRTPLLGENIRSPRSIINFGFPEYS